MTIGIDLEEVIRFEKNYKEVNFLNLIFSKKEIDYCFLKKAPYRSLAGKFCAKEAVKKALQKNISIKDIEILNDKEGKIFVNIKGKLNKMIKCSISHTKKYATAIAIIEK
ncbi:MAG: holo-ACP synthase [archaeon]